jgi:hypothetical protein
MLADEILPRELRAAVGGAGSADLRSIAGVALLGAPRRLDRYTVDYGGGSVRPVTREERAVLALGGRCRVDAAAWFVETAGPSSARAGA